MSWEFILILAAFGGSFGLALLTAFVRFKIGGFDVHSLSDLITASIAFQISLLTTGEALAAYVPNAGVRAFYTEWWFLWLVAAGASYVVSVRPGEVLWANRHRVAHDPEAYGHSVAVGFLLGWVLPVLWATHYVIMFVLGTPE